MLTSKLYSITYKLALYAMAVTALAMSGCAIINDGDRELALKVLEHGEAGCIHIQGSGGAGAGAIPPGIPMGGGYGQGSLTAAHSNTPGAKLHCGADGASVE